VDRKIIIRDTQDTNDDILQFYKEDLQNNDDFSSSKWKLLIVDDEEEVHNVTKLALQDLIYKRRPINFLHAYTEKQAIEILKENADISLILLDIVMEEDNSGLKIIDYIRNVMKNIFVRIVIRTGQPG